MSRKKKALIAAAAALLLVVLAIIAYSGYRLIEIDINTGRMRTSVYYFYCIRVSREVGDTGLSKLAAQYGLGKEPPIWKPVVKARRGVYGFWDGTYCYRYGAVRAQIHLFEECLKESPPVSEAQRKALTEVMGYLQRDDPYTAADQLGDIIREWLK